jgi:hypothetical protein
MKIAWYAQRLRAMSAGEIVHRMRERLGRCNEPAKLKRISRRAWDGTFADFPKLPWRQHVPPDLRKQLAADAEKLVRGEWADFWLEKRRGRRAAVLASRCDAGRGD